MQLGGNMSGEKKKKKKISARAVESEFVATHANLTSSPLYRLGLRRWF
jgi:hypothetical protein